MNAFLSQTIHYWERFRVFGSEAAVFFKASLSENPSPGSVIIQQSDAANYGGSAMG